MREVFKSYFRNYCFMMGTMSIPAFVIDLILYDSDSRFFWLVFAFSVIVPVLNMLYESLNIFKEKVILRRIVFFIIIVAVLMTFSWKMGIINSFSILMLGIGVFTAIGIPAMVLLGIHDKKDAEALNAKLQEYKRNIINNNDIDKAS